MTWPEATGPLTGTVVVDLSRALAGPHATMMLGDMGARVIKVESPGGGDESRHWGPPFAGSDDANRAMDISAPANAPTLETARYWLG